MITKENHGHKTLPLKTSTCVNLMRGVVMLTIRGDNDCSSIRAISWEVRRQEENIASNEGGSRGACEREVLGKLHCGLSALVGGQEIWSRVKSQNPCGSMGQFP